MRGYITEVFDLISEILIQHPFFNNLLETNEDVSEKE
jgi:hypothetical protein